MSDSPATAAPPAEICVVLIDDDREDYLIHRDILADCEGSKFRVEWVNNFTEGLARVKEQKADVFLVDYRLGPDDGLKLLREAIAAGCKAPLIMLTGQGDRDVDLEAMSAGAADYLVKSQIDGPLLERSIRYAIERRRAQEERERLIRELQAALAKIKTLRGLVPICSYCKKIRDDKGYWKQVEEYIRDRTEADFTHGLCPECYERLINEIDTQLPGGKPPKK